MISEATKLIFPLLSNDLNIAVKKFKHFENNVLKSILLKSKPLGRHLVECPQNILAYNFEESLNKLDH